MSKGEKYMNEDRIEMLGPLEFDYNCKNGTDRLLLNIDARIEGFGRWLVLLLLGVELTIDEKCFRNWYSERKMDAVKEKWRNRERERDEERREEREKVREYRVEWT